MKTMKRKALVITAATAVTVVTMSTAVMAGGKNHAARGGSHEYCTQQAVCDTGLPCENTEYCGECGEYCSPEHEGELRQSGSRGHSRNNSCNETHKGQHHADTEDAHGKNHGNHHGTEQ